MIVTKERCFICGGEHDFVIDDKATLLREAKCTNCGASVRNSDTASEILSYINVKSRSLSDLSDDDINPYLILNTCSSGPIHKALEKYRTYICSEYSEETTPGEYFDGIMSVDLTNIPFPDDSLDIIISEDVFEHVADYPKAMQEIRRVLRPGGVHIFTVPIHDGKKTVSRVGKKDVYHGDPNPANGGDGTLVYTDWGEDITAIVSEFGFDCKLLKKHSFYKPEDVIDVDSSYEEYLKHTSDLQNYLKYNSYVLVSKKNGNGKRTELSTDWYSKHELNKLILFKCEELHELSDDDEARGKHIKKLDAEIDIYRERIKYFETETKRLQSENDKMCTKIESLEQEICNKNGHIEQLLEVERTYERDRASRSYKVALGIRKVSHFLFPLNSKRRFFAKVLGRCIRHPSFIPTALNPKRIKKYFDTVKADGMDGVNMRYKHVENYDTQRLGEIDNKNLDLIPSNSGKKMRFEDYENLSFEEYESPEVSVVIPVYNQFDYTYNCLKSILKHSGDVSYEIIIGDDCSDDYTSRITEIVTGVKVIRNEENLRFLLNCNNAAKYANGEYILFLNNDTQVQDNWLKPLVDLMADNTIGMVGSKLVYADGRLQEAGGILWKDGSAWNYGNKMNPEDPEYNYVKEVDYISGAAIMIRKSLWNEIGGFDERYVPAYCEDSDLAFEVRKHGYKVVYQPLSVVVHFEGVSNGTDISSGLKAYQVENGKKFYEKWKEVLEAENFPNGENVLLARDRSRFKKHILVVDQYVPLYDQDAGCKNSYMYLLMFLRMGFQVTFIGDNFFKHEPYTTELNQKGIEVLYGSYYCKNWKKFFRDNLNHYEYVYLQRPHISTKYIDAVKEYSNAKIIYYAHDLHFLREKREYDITGNEEKLVSSEKWKKIEYDLFSKADVGYVVGTYELGVVSEAFPNKPIRGIPIYTYDHIPENIEKDFSKRQDLIFVGGFGHPPNIDGIVWFGNEIMPLIVKKYPDIKLHVVGSKAPDDVLSLASDNIIIEGFLSDEELEDLYRRCRIDVAPLRFGAGIKGKVVEAAYYQIPLVTTSIGAEGLDDSMGNMCVLDNAEDIATFICDAYTDFEKLREMSEAGARFIERYFTPECAENILKQDISI